ncbi:hypothetical protein AB0D04_03110 [Streptomyces sp. NPDC048483]|uniref:hypothetical protein n=1 Tax=Streptomyces sp. NPDC048483 TaxID=3154927 RepID=UPI00343B2778
MSGDEDAQCPEDLEYEDERSVPMKAPATPGEWELLADNWAKIHEGYYLGSARHAVLECARHLEASVAAGAADTALWVLGLYYIGDYVIHGSPHAESEHRVREVMAGVERALGGVPCSHPSHPCDDAAEEVLLEGFPAVLGVLAHPERDEEYEAGLAEELADEDGHTDDAWRQSWYGARLTREIWACPRNLAGFARALFT